MEEENSLLDICHFVFFGYSYNTGSPDLSKRKKVVEKGAEIA
jgi:hypothetical protein